MFIQLLKRYSLIGILLTTAVIALYIHTSIHTDYIPEEYNIYAVVYGHFGETNSSTQNIKGVSSSNKESEKEGPEDKSFFDIFRLENNL